MTAGITGVDHPVLAVRDLSAARTTYERLGFTVPPLGAHLEWGTGNLCIMFPDDYLELRGIVDGSRYTHHLDKFLDERGEGMMGVAFGTEDAEASHAGCIAAGVEPAALKSLTRRFELPEGDAFPRFRIVYLAERDVPGLLTTVICGHLTPEIIRKPEFLIHANGAVGVHSLVSVVEDPQSVAPSYRKLLGDDLVDVGRDVCTLMFPHGARIEFVSPGEARTRGIIEGGPQLPVMPSVTVSVESLAAASLALEANGIPTDLVDRQLRVGPEHACGTILFFREAKG